MKSTRCPTCRRLMKRNNEQNRRYWALLHAISESLKPQGSGFSVESWHSYFKSRFLGVEEVKLPNGKTLLIPNSSADLDVGEFVDYMTKVEVWANDHDVYLEDAEGALA